jgi:hypothetical protein
MPQLPSISDSESTSSSALSPSSGFLFPHLPSDAESPLSTPLPPSPGLPFSPAFPGGAAEPLPFGTEDAAATSSYNEETDAFGQLSLALDDGDERDIA